MKNLILFVISFTFLPLAQAEDTATGPATTSGYATEEKIETMKDETEHDRSILIINDHARRATAFAGLTPFTTDGCSVVPEEYFELTNEYQRCCIVHDLDYWVGGTKAERKQSDKDLRQCLKDNGVNKIIAANFYWGVRMGGRPGTGHSYEWGYGWEDNPGYKERSEALRETEGLDLYISEEFNRTIEALPYRERDEAKLEALHNRMTGLSEE